MGWIPGTKEVGKQENLLPGCLITDVSCSWTQLALRTKDGECVLWSNYTNEKSKPAKVKNSGIKFKAVGCRESSCLLLTGGSYLLFSIKKNHFLLSNGNSIVLSCLQVQVNVFCFADNGQAGYAVHEEVQDGCESNKPALLFRPMDITTQMTSVACGKEHALLLSSSGDVYSLGGGRYGSMFEGISGTTVWQETVFK